MIVLVIAKKVFMMVLMVNKVVNMMGLVIATAGLTRRLTRWGFKGDSRAIQGRCKGDSSGIQGRFKGYAHNIYTP